MKRILAAIIILVVGCSVLPYNAAKHGALNNSEIDERILIYPEIIECNAPGKIYGSDEVDSFLEISYNVCMMFRKAQELLFETNKIIASPDYVIAESSERRATLKKELMNMIIEISGNVIKNSYPLIQESIETSNAATKLKGLDKIRAEKDIIKARDNLVDINKTAPKVLNYMNALASKLSG